VDQEADGTEDFSSVNHWPKKQLPRAPKFPGDPDPKDWLPIERAIFRAWAKSLKDYPDKPKKRK